ncbi:MAG: relaxase/mobilization nuclease domain-containing protein [Thiomicrospira sp.]
MLSKFFSHGNGRGQAPIAYLLGVDGQREGARILKGNPALLEAVIDSLAAQGRRAYTSGVLSFGETVSDAVKADCMAAYDRFLSADGVAALQTLWVEHTDKGRTELHFVVANVDLETGRSYTPYLDRFDRRTRDALDDHLTAKHGGADPDDPRRARQTATAADYLKVSGDRKKLAAMLDARIAEEAAHFDAIERAWTQADAVATFEGLGFDVTRTGRDYISVFHPSMGKAMRLKGGLFSRDGHSQPATRPNPRERAEEAFLRFETALEKRAARAKQRLLGEKTENPRYDQKTRYWAFDEVFEPLEEKPKATLQNLSKAAESTPTFKVLRFRGRVLGKLAASAERVEVEGVRSPKAAAYHLVRAAVAQGMRVVAIEGGDEAGLREAYRLARKRGLDVLPCNEAQEKIFKSLDGELEDERALKGTLAGFRAARRRLGAIERGTRRLTARTRSIAQDLQAEDEARPRIAPGVGARQERTDASRADLRRL